MKRTRVLLFTGKGGVGKTTVAAATALRAAEQGKRTLVLSSDPAHSLADALDRPLGPEPREVVPNLFAQEVDHYYSMRKHWGNLRELMLTAFKWQGVSEVAAEELAALPGMNEGSVLVWLEELVASNYVLRVRLTLPNASDPQLASPEVPRILQARRDENRRRLAPREIRPGSLNIICAPNIICGNLCASVARTARPSVSHR